MRDRSGEMNGWTDAQWQKRIDARKRRKERYAQIRTERAKEAEVSGEVMSMDMMMALLLAKKEEEEK